MRYAVANTSYGNSPLFPNHCDRPEGSQPSRHLPLSINCNRVTGSLEEITVGARREIGGDRFDHFRRLPIDHQMP